MTIRYVLRNIDENQYNQELSGGYLPKSSRQHIRPKEHINTVKLADIKNASWYLGDEFQNYISKTFDFIMYNNDLKNIHISESDTTNKYRHTSFHLKRFDDEYCQFKKTNRISSIS